MKGSQGKMSTQEEALIEMYWKGIIILHHHQLVCGHKQGEEVTKKNILLRRIIDGMRNRMFHIMQSILLGSC